MSQAASMVQLLTDGEGRVLAASAGAGEALGFPGGAVPVGRSCRDLVAAFAPGGQRVCTTDCAANLSGVKEQGVVGNRKGAWNLTCNQLHPFNVITLRPAPGAALQDEALTPREQEVLALIAIGYTNAQIARQLGLCTSTVRTHVEHILARLQVPNRAAAAARVLAAGRAACPGSQAAAPRYASGGPQRTRV